MNTVPMATFIGKRVIGIAAGDEAGPRRGRFVLDGVLVDEVFLRPVDRAARTLAAAAGLDTTDPIELLHPHGSSVFAAIVRPLRWSPIHRLLVVTNAERFVQRELRSAHRVLAAVPVVLTTPTGVVIQGTTRDVSATGIAIVPAGVTGLTPGDTVVVALELPDGTLTAAATVVATDDSGDDAPLVRAILRVASLADDQRLTRFIHQTELSRPRLRSV
jgi:PilZ domain